MESSLQDINSTLSKFFMKYILDFELTLYEYFLCVNSCIFDDCANHTDIRQISCHGGVCRWKLHIHSALMNNSQFLLAL